MTTREIADVANLTDSARGLIQEDSTPRSFVDQLEEQALYEDALRFLAHKLPIDAGIKWAVASVRDLQAPDQKDRKNDPLEAAEAWIKAPGDPARWTAKDAADKARETSTASLIALAVFFSGGSITAPEAPEVHPPPYAAQKMVAGSIQVAVLTHEPQHAVERYRRALLLGRKEEALVGTI